MKLQLLIVVFSIFMTSCSTTIIPLRSRIDKIDARIENPEKGKIYRLLGTSYQDGIVGEIQHASGIISFDLSGTAKETEKCYFFWDGTKHIPIRDKIFKFSNPAIKNYVPIKIALNKEESNLLGNKNLLDKHVAYPNGECILLSTYDMPKQPSSACHPQEEETFSQTRCKNTTFNPSLWSKVKNWARCAAVAATGGLFHPVVALGAGLTCSLVSSEIDEENQYILCIANSINACRKSYTEWADNIRYLTNNSNELYQGCLQMQQTIKRSTARISDLTAELDKSAQMWTSITEDDYCY